MRAVSPVPSSLGHGEATPLLTRWLFVFFLVSGACSLVYQVVWLRLAMALFGVAPALVAVILSAFMAGLALGSWGAGALARRVPSARATFPLRLYALAELLIAMSGQVVPPALAQGRDVLAEAGPGMAWSSLGHLAASGLWVAAVLIPFCACMGATIPLGMWAIRSGLAAPESRSFSYLYVANVLGACLGTLASGFVLIEAFGFRGTGLVASGFNALIAAGALAVSLALDPRPAR